MSTGNTNLLPDPALRLPQDPGIPRVEGVNPSGVSPSLDGVSHRAGASTLAGSSTAGGTGERLPDGTQLAQIAQLANDFFRAIPVASPFPGYGQPPVPTVLPSIPYQSSGAGPATAFETVLPEFGLAVPGVPALPSANRLPSEADLARISGSADTSQLNRPEISSFAPSGGLLGSGSSVSPATSPFSTPLSDPLPGGFPADFSFPLISPDSAAQPFSYAQLTELCTAGFQPPVETSPFARPLPKFDAGLRAYQLDNYPTESFAIPDVPALATGLNAPGLDATALPGHGLPDEATARKTLESAFAYYFLENARALSPETYTSTAPAYVYEPALAPESPYATVPNLGLARKQFSLESIRADFPILNEKVNGKPLIWLDNAATTQKPQAVIDRLSYFYEHENSNIHRAAHELAARATDAYEDARQKTTRFLNATSSKEIVFVRGATEAINLVAKSWGKRHIQKDDEIVISWIEHHANIVPWQQLAAENGARLRVIPVDDDGQILMPEYEKLLSPKTRLVSVTQVSNALGTVTPVHAIVQAAHRYGARVLIDGAQAVSHMRVDVQSIDCDFYVFSGHKVFGPTGIGVLYGKPDALEEAPPWQGGGNMIVDVTFEKTTYHHPPARFEAGTGNIADAVGLGAAIDYVEAVGMENIARHEHDLLIYATRELLTIPGLKLIGTAKEKAGVLSFVLDGFKTEEVGAALNREGIAVRSGHHCAQPSLRRFGVETTVRPSLALYNSFGDIDAMIAALRRLKSVGA